MPNKNDIPLEHISYAQEPARPAVVENTQSVLLSALASIARAEKLSSREVILAMLHATRRIIQLSGRGMCEECNREMNADIEATFAGAPNLSRPVSGFAKHTAEEALTDEDVDNMAKVIEIVLSRLLNPSATVKVVTMKHGKFGNGGMTDESQN